MSKAISTERLFSLPSFEGLRLIRIYAEKQPDLDTTNLLELIENVEPDGASLDLEASAYLDTLVEADCPLEGPLFYQICIKIVLIRHQPLWAKSMRQGRKRFVKTLDKNDQDIFFAAGLMQDPPPTEIVAWWDTVASHARLLSDADKMEQARSAEKLTIEHERERLANLGIRKEPAWMGLDDNFAGYDVLSYDFGEHGIVSKMIEVKSTTASPLKFILTRNEWEQAKKVGASYIFHIWDMAQFPPILHVRTVDEISPHIPSDNKKGKWGTTAIPVGTYKKTALSE